jgi:hypothetical protein
VATIIKLKRSTTASSVPTTSDLTDGEVAVNIVDQKIYIRNGGSIVELANASGTDLSSVGEDILPSTTETYNLGSSSKRWNELFLAGTTINLGGATISSDGTGSIQISGAGATLPVNSKVEISLGNQKKLALIDDNTGASIRSVPFFSAAGGLSTANAYLNFKASSTSTVANFTLANGSTLAEQQDELFLF